jgi:hypothetical protein
MFGQITKDFKTILEKHPGMTMYNYPKLYHESTVEAGTQVEFKREGKWYVVTFVDSHTIRWYFRMSFRQRMEYVENRKCTQSPFAFPTVVVHK